MAAHRRKAASKVAVGQGRETKLGRRRPFRDSRSIALLVTNGLKTEKQYFVALRTEDWTHPFHVTTKNGSPAALVEFAASEKNNSDYDSVWCVCDIDSFDVTDALETAETADIGLALSVPCFEFWLLLHLVDCRKPFQNANELKREIRKHIRDWDKTRLRFADFREGVQEAVKRAKALEPPPDSNPSTSVWMIIEALTSFE